MQQFCTYGSVRGALGQLASLPRQNAFSLPLAHARGSVTASESTPVFLSRDREGAVRSAFQQPASGCPGNNWTQRGADDRFPSSAFVS
jgi:hypothetical protein